jgi:tripartite-type tricarboxylate transporter receptor subunit TctC
MITRRVFAAGAALIAAGTARSRAQAYPVKPIRLIVPFSAGGPADVMARVAGQRMGTILGQNLIVENRPGAGGTIGARAAAQAEPDGYTLMLANTSTLVIGPLVYRNVDYDPLRSFALIAAFGTTSNILVVNPRVPATTVAALIGLAKAQPGKLSYASPGIGTPPHLIGELLKLKTGIDLVHVPYKGGGQSVGDVVAGQVQIVFENPSITLPLVRAGQVRALATTGATRNPAAPDIPTMIEAGVPDFVSVSFTGLVAPAGTPAPIVARLNAAANDALMAPDVHGVLAKLAVESKPGSPAEFAAFVAAETDKWRTVVEAAKIRIE